MKGRIGNTVFRQHQGQQIASQYQPLVANPRSAMQQAQRTLFVALLALGRLLRPVIVVGFKEYNGRRMSWLNKFQSTNSAVGLYVWNSGTSSWDYNPQALVISEGSLQQNVFTVTGVTVGGLVLNWDATPIANQSSDDKLSYLVTVDDGEPVFFRFNGGAPVDRSAGTAPVSVTIANGQVVTVVAFFVRNDGTIVSNSWNGTFTAVIP